MSVILIVFFFFYCFLFFIFSTPNLWGHFLTERISTKLGCIFTYDCCLKNIVRTFRTFTHTGWGKEPLFGNNFEFWPNISLERNMISAIEKKRINLQGLPFMSPKFGELWSRSGWKWLAGFGQPPKFSHFDTLPALPHRLYITDSRQTLARVM